jgi:hypothetical protein
MWVDGGVLPHSRDDLVPHEEFALFFPPLYSHTLEKSKRPEYRGSKHSTESSSPRVLAPSSRGADFPAFLFALRSDENTNFAGESTQLELGSAINMPKSKSLLKDFKPKKKVAKQVPYFTSCGSRR